MTTTTRRTTPTTFPTGTTHATTGEWVPGWVRTYPATMDLSGQDHLAVGSGAWRRYADDPGCFVRANDRWVEDLSGVAFEDVDADYLSYLVSTGRGYVSRNIAAWVKTPEGKYAFSDTVYAGRETGWMYKTLGSLACHRAKRDSDDVLSESGFCVALDDPDGDTGLNAGRTWGSADPDWKPEPHEAYAILEQIKGRRVAATYETHRAGTFARVAAVVVRADRGDKAFELRGKWLPDSFGFPVVVDTGLGQTTVWVRRTKDLGGCDGEVDSPTFVDRHAWDAVLWAAGELRELYTRVIERGDECVPTDSELGPVAWVYEHVAEVMALVPGGELKDVRLAGFRAEVRKMANACLDAVERMELPVKETTMVHGFGKAVPIPVDELRYLDLELLAKAYCRRVGYRPSRRRVRVTRGRDWACCQ